MGKIVAIGGGEMNLKETLPIDRYIVEFSGKQKPKMLFIPTASNDAEGYIEVVKKIYGCQLGCEIDTLLLMGNSITESQIREKILSADIIYVGGGDTVRMMDVWRARKVDGYLREAYRNNIVLSGISAGSICWFTKGHGDSSAEGWWDHKQAEGIGLIPAIHCPHYNEKGAEGFDKAMKKEEIPGIAVENNCAFVVKDAMYKIIKSDESSKAYLFKNNGGTVNKTELTAHNFESSSAIF